MRNLLIFAGVVVVLLAVLDQVAVRVVESQLATRAQRSEGLATRPDVSLGGFPFLTQVVSGRYRDVDVTVDGYTQAGVRVDQVRAELDGVHVPLSDVVRGQVESVPVDSVRAEVDLTFDDVNAYLDSQAMTARVQPEGDVVRVSGAVGFLGMTYQLSGTAQIGVVADAVTFTPREISAAVGLLLPPGLREAAIGMLTVKVPVTGLPFNMALNSAVVSPTASRSPPRARTSSSTPRQPPEVSRRRTAVAPRRRTRRSARPRRGRAARRGRRPPGRSTGPARRPAGCRARRPPRPARRRACRRRRVSSAVQSPPSPPPST